MRILFVGLSGLLVACGGVTEEEFTDQAWGMTCDLTFECTTAEEIEAAGDWWIFGADADACKALLDEAEESEDTAAAGGEEAEETCEFDSDKGQACLDAMAELDCDAAESPAACGDLCVDE